jgi:ribosomal protein S27AE
MPRSTRKAGWPEMRIVFCTKCGRTAIMSNGNGTDRCWCGNDEYTDKKPSNPVPVLADSHQPEWKLSEQDAKFLRALRIAKD